MLAPPEAELIALSDQDDRWYPEKLKTLREALGDAELAYSDARLVDGAGAVRRDTLWRGRRVNYTNLASLLISNTVPGVVRCSAGAPSTAPFRSRTAPAGTSMITGWRWSRSPWATSPTRTDPATTTSSTREPYSATWSPKPRGPRGAERVRLLDRWRPAYFGLYLQAELQAQVLLTRCAAELTPRKHRALSLLIDAQRSPLAFGWLAIRPARALAGRNETLGTEAIMARGVAWRYLIGLRPARRAGASSVPSFELQGLGSRLRRWLAHR